MDILIVVYISMGSMLAGVGLGFLIGAKMIEKKKEEAVSNVLEGLPEALKIPADAQRRSWQY